jgi:outer membrane protein assembly factor BamB
MLSQLSYIPDIRRLGFAVGVLGFEPRTSALSELRSSQLSYTPPFSALPLWFRGNKKAKPQQVWPYPLELWIERLAHLANLAGDQDHTHPPAKEPFWGRKVNNRDVARGCQLKKCEIAGSGKRLLATRRRIGYKEGQGFPPDPLILNPPFLRYPPVNHRLAARCLLAVSFPVLALAASARGDNWPQWRGPDNNGISKEKNVPTEWDATKNVVWKLKMPGMGSGTPAVWGDRIFLTSEDDKDLVLICVSTKGEQLWKKRLGASDGSRYMRGEGNLASASPSTDGKNVWCLVGTGDLACFDLDGKEVWKFNLQERYGKFGYQHGFHTTPLLHGDRLYVQLFHNNAEKVVALNKANGEEVWKIERKTDARGEGLQAYASPLIARNGKDEYLIVHGGDYATGHQLKDGAEIWRVGDLNYKDKYNTTYRFVSSPVATPDLIVVPSCKNGPVVGLKPDATGLVAAGGAGELWRYEKTPDVCSPLVLDGLVYLCGDGNITCLDGKTGKKEYGEPIEGGIYRASPVYANGNIYLTSRNGAVTVVKAGKKFESVAVNKLPEKITASPVIVDGRIYLRGWDTLYAIGK